jgi:hypothetical protein
LNYPESLKPLLKFRCSFLLRRPVGGLLFCGHSPGWGKRFHILAL